MKFLNEIDNASMLKQDATHRLVADTQITAWNSLREDSNSALVAEVRTDDPVSPVVGRIWFRSDL